jgi:hypothetical protein
MCIVIPVVPTVGYWHVIWLLGSYFSMAVHYLYVDNGYIWSFLSDIKDHFVHAMVCWKCQDGRKAAILMTFNLSQCKVVCYLS